MRAGHKTTPKRTVRLNRRLATVPMAWLGRVPSGVLAAIAFTLCAEGQTPTGASRALSPVDRYDYIASTQAIGGLPQLDPSSDPLVEAARQMLGMGTSVIKFRLTGNPYAKERDSKITSLPQLVREPAFQQIFEMPFAHYILWTHALSTDHQVTPWHGHMKKEVLGAEYKEIYDLTQYLLRTYNGTGKSFYLGNREGDWLLLEGSPKKARKWDQIVNPDAPQGMIDWLTNRQRAVDDARSHTPHQDVQVYFYVEANAVQKSIKQGLVSVAQDVLPFVNPDYASFSSYDSTKPDKDLHHDLPAALDYLQSRLKPKPGLPEKRVFVGEYESIRKDFTPVQQDAYMRDVIATSIKWGTPFVLYWALYSNATYTDGSFQRCWLIDNQGVKQPAYYTYQTFDRDARAFVSSALRKSGRVPPAKEFQDFAYKWFTNPDTRPR